MLKAMRERLKRREGVRWSLSFTASVICHVVLAAFVVFTHTPHPLPKAKYPKSMDVVLLEPSTKKPEKPPEEAEAISNRTARGASARAIDHVTRAARSPVIGKQRRLPRPAAPQLPPSPPPAPAPSPEKRARTLARRGLRLEPKPTPKPPKAKPPPKRPLRPKSIPLANLMPSTAALAQLSRDFERERRLKKMLSREAEVPINTREAKYAPYAQQLVRALEEQWRPGQANYAEYPEEERRVLMQITIEGNGDLSRLKIIRPSPIARLNDSAVAAVHAASPFRPLPSAWGLDRVTFYLTFEIIEDRFVFRTM